MTSLYAAFYKDQHESIINGEFDKYYQYYTWSDPEGSGYWADIIPPGCYIWSPSLPVDSEIETCFADTMVKNNIEFLNFYIQLTSKQIGYMGDSEAVACLSPETLKIAEAHRHMYDVPMRDCITEIIIPRDDLPVDKVILETP